MDLIIQQIRDIQANLYKKTRRTYDTVILPSAYYKALESELVHYMDNRAFLKEDYKEKFENKADNTLMISCIGGPVTVLEDHAYPRINYSISELDFFILKDKS